MGMARIEGLWHQRQLWADHTQDASIAVVGPLGCGKTVGLAVKAYDLAARNKRLPGGLVVPTIGMARKIHEREWPEFFQPLGIDLRWRGGNDPYFEWPWGAITHVVSADKPHRIVGSNWAYMLGDEPAKWPREAWDRAVARVRHPRAVLRQKVLGGTPEGNQGWFAELFADPAPGYRTIVARSWHSALVPHYPKLLLETYGYDEAQLATYLRGEFVAMGAGLCFGQFESQRHLTEEAQYDRALPLVIGCDFNVDWMRWVVCQLGRDHISVIDEIALGKGASTRQAADELVRRWRPRHDGKVVVCGDAAGAARSTTGKSDYQELRAVLRQANFLGGVSFRVPRGNPRHKDSVHAVNHHLAGRGGRLVRIDPKRCKALVADFGAVHWREGTAEIEKKTSGPEARYTHASDAFRYVIWSLARPTIEGSTSRLTKRNASMGAF